MQADLFGHAPEIMVSVMWADMERFLWVNSFETNKPHVLMWQLWKGGFTSICGARNAPCLVFGLTSFKVTFKSGKVVEVEVPTMVGLIWQINDWFTSDVHFNLCSPFVWHSCRYGLIESKASIQQSYDMEARDQELYAIFGLVYINSARVSLLGKMRRRSNL